MGIGIGIGEILENFGPLGLCLFVLFYVLKKFFSVMETYRSDRIKWLEDSERMNNKMIKALNTHSKFLGQILRSLKRLEDRNG